MSEYASVIVTYNPDLEAFRSRLDAIRSLGTDIFIVDNSEPQKPAALFGDVKVISMGANRGVAAALNAGFSAAAATGAKWVLAFDQDSTPHEGFLEIYKKFIGRFPGVGQIGCAYTGFEPFEGARHVEHVITSGSITSISAWQEVGGFREDLFIDMVDIEFSLRLGNVGYDVWQIGEARLDHNLGEGRRGLMLGGKLRFQYVEHAPVRWYYIVRNALAVCKDSKLSHRLFCKKYLRKVRRSVAKMCLFGTDRLTKLTFIRRGIKDWKSGTMGKYQ